MKKRIPVIYLFLFVLINTNSILFSQSVQLPKYSPVPAAVPGVESVKIDLNGIWQFNPNPDSKFYEVSSSPGWKDIKVPGEWFMQGFVVKPKTKAGYLRTFQVPTDWQNKTIKLRCDGIYSDADIHINGKPAGRHQGGFNAFELDVSNIVEAGKKNTITVGVTSESLTDTLASATQYAAHQLGGITRKIYLMALPKINITSLKITTDFEKGFRDALMKVHLGISNETEKEITRFSVICRLENPAGQSVDLSNLKNIPEKIPPGKSIERTLEYKITAPEKWDAEHPNLYELTIEFESSGQKEIIKQKVGFRQIEIIGNQLFVNGRPVKLKGSNRHEVHPLLGRSLNDELWKKDAELFKGANFNYIRTSHYPPAEEFINHCDELGLFVELEAPFCWVGHNANERWNNSDPHSNFLLQTILRLQKETVEFYRNHPSILIWSLANESEWGANWAEDLKMITALDPTRPSSFHDQAYAGYNNAGSTAMPIANYHYPSPGDIHFTRKYNRPLLFGEYAHINTYNREEIVADPGVRDSWGRGFEPFVDDMFYAAGNLGGAIWAGIDDVFYLPDGKAVGYGEWGIIDGWRRIKPEYWHAKKSYSPVKVHTNIIKIPKSGEPIKVQIENRFDFTNLNEIKIECILEGKKIVVPLNVLPRSLGILSFIPRSYDLNGKILDIKFYSNKNNILDEYSIPIGKTDFKTVPFNTVSPSKIQLLKNTDNVEIKSSSFSWVVNSKTGQITKGELNGKTIITAGPVFMLLPLKTGPCVTEHSLDIQPFNDVCKNWLMTSFEAVDSSGIVIVKVSGSFDEAEGKLIYKFFNTGRLEVEYNFKSKIDLNPRQWGLVFTADRSFDNLRWKRNGQWNAYPENHIGRAEGEAKAFNEQFQGEWKYGIEPKWDWRFDSNKLGTNDFRSTRDNIYWAALSGPEATGVMVTSDGSNSFRSFIDGNSVKFLVASFSTGGGDLFFSTHLTAERRPVKKGDTLKGTASLTLIK